MRQVQEELEVETRGRGLLAVTGKVQEWLGRQRVGTGLLVVFLPHTSASLLVQENADPDVLEDLESFFAKLVPDGDASYLHSAEGPDDMPSHIRSALTQTQLTIPVSQGRMVLGTWQGLYVYEHRVRPHPRRLVLHYLGD